MHNTDGSTRTPENWSASTETWKLWSDQRVEVELAISRDQDRAGKPAFGPTSLSGSFTTDQGDMEIEGGLMFKDSSPAEPLLDNRYTGSLLPSDIGAREPPDDGEPYSAAQEGFYNTAAILHAHGSFHGYPASYGGLPDVGSHLPSNTGGENRPDDGVFHGAAQEGSYKTIANPQVHDSFNGFAASYGGDVFTNGLPEDIETKEALKKNLKALTDVQRRLAYPHSDETIFSIDLIDLRNNKTYTHYFESVDFNNLGWLGLKEWNDTRQAFIRDWWGEAPGDLKQHLRPITDEERKKKATATTLPNDPIFIIDRIYEPTGKNYPHEFTRPDLSNAEDIARWNHAVRGHYIWIWWGPKSRRVQKSV